MKLGVIGLGNMGAALVRGFLTKRKDLASSVYLHDRNSEKMSVISADFPDVNLCWSVQEVWNQVDVLVLAVKPQGVCSLLRSLPDNQISRDYPTIVSVAASVSIETMAECLASGTGILRAMPNTPCKCQRGIIAYDKNNNVPMQHEEFVKEFFLSCAQVFHVPEEKLDIITAISGSGPAYMYLMLEAMTECGEKHGLSSELALTLATETMLGAAQMVKSSDDSPAQLRKEVTSPHGTTQAGLKALENAGFSESIHSAVDAAYQRALELKRENR